MRHILLIINVIGILWYNNMPQDICSSRLNKNISFNLQTYNQEIHNQIKQLPDSIVKNIQWQYLDSFICFNSEHDIHPVWRKDNQAQIAYIKDLQDTIYIMQLNGLQGDFKMTLWNKKKKLSYTNETGLIKNINNRLFTKYMLKLISDWNIAAIREEEKINAHLLPKERIYAIRIILHKEKCSIDFLWFYDFFNIERDRTDFL